MSLPPQAIFGDMALPNTRLHYVKAGMGAPLIIVPATVSLIRQWLPLTQFMGQRFTSYFFELPGHGGSTPYPEKFKSQFVPRTVEEFVNNLGYDKFNLMGFSFGGLLALRTLEHLQDRIEKVILLSPCVSRRALKWSMARQWAFKASIKAMKNQRLLQGIHYVMNMCSLTRWMRSSKRNTNTPAHRSKSPATSACQSMTIYWSMVSPNRSCKDTFSRSRSSSSHIHITNRPNRRRSSG